jgi:hypothetical protein
MTIMSNATVTGQVGGPQDRLTDPPACIRLAERTFRSELNEALGRRPRATQYFHRVGGDPRPRAASHQGWNMERHPSLPILRKIQGLFNF